jgi:hypothetical protein
MVFPIVLGSGKRLFNDTGKATTLKLADRRSWVRASSSSPTSRHARAGRQGLLGPILEEGGRDLLIPIEVVEEIVEEGLPASGSLEELRRLD